MYIPVVLKSGNEELVRKDELQFLMSTEKIMFFKRSEGWVVPGRDRMRTRDLPYTGEDRRQHEVFSLDC
jgi:hypothetical protein